MVWQSPGTSFSSLTVRTILLASSVFDSCIALFLDVSCFELPRFNFLCVHFLAYYGSVVRRVRPAFAQDELGRTQRPD